MSGRGTPRNGHGILACGVYLPVLRLPRRIIADAMAWAAPSARGHAGGARTVANWDEDALTMAVEAARNCLAGRSRAGIARVVLASTTAPFADRSNAGIAADALSLGEAIATTDAGGSRRAATGELLRALRDGVAGETLLMASDCRAAKPGSPQEMRYGHGAAAVLVGAGNPVAVLRGAASVHRDLVDQYRSTGAPFDYGLEERWVREEGWLKIVPVAAQSALQDAGIAAKDVAVFALAGPAAMATSLAKQLGCTGARVVDTLQERVGDCGAAHPLLMLAGALDGAAPGDIILLAGFGQGADALVLEVTPAIAAACVPDVGAAAVGGRELAHYLRYLVLRRLVEFDHGIRAERDNRTALSTFYRRRDAITGFTGGRCTACGLLQFPRTAHCVGCAARDTQAPESLAELEGAVKSFTEDWQAYTPGPPLIYGNITFPGGGNVMMEFADFDSGEAQVGQRVRMAFRIKDFDDRRGFRRYFWKPVPLRPEADRG